VRGELKGAGHVESLCVGLRPLGRLAQIRNSESDYGDHAHIGPPSSRLLDHPNLGYAAECNSRSLDYAAQAMHTLVAGRAAKRSGAIRPPQRSHVQ
jgi:hypothetical protein